MADSLPPLKALKAFESAARHMSLKRAAQELNVTPAAVSHQVKALEDYLGVQLFRRLNRGLELTPVARAALPRLSEGFERLAQGVAAMRPQADTGRLTVSAAPSFAARWLMPRLHGFFAARPEVDVRVSARMRFAKQGELDRDAERATIEKWLEDSDIAILYGHGKYPGYETDRLLALSLAPICSPQLLHAEHPLRRSQDLKYHTLLHDDTGLLYDGKAFWEVWLKAAGMDGVDSSRGSHFSHAVLALEAAADALGVVATFPVLADADIKSGRLVMPFEIQAELPSAYYLVCSEAAARRPVVVAFRAWLRTEAERAMHGGKPAG